MDTIFTVKHRAMIKAIRRLREAKGLRQVDVANRMQVPVYVVVRIESGQRRLDLIEYWRLAQAIGFDPWKLAKKIFKAHNKR